MERYFIFDNINTWYNWRLILTAKDVTPPEPKTNYVELDGMDGTLDLSESLTGEITYKDRTVTAAFWTDYGRRADRERLIKDIVRTLHGKKVKIIEPDDPDHYFVGRVSVKPAANLIPYAELSITATCEPWRYAVAETVRSVDLSNTSLTSVVIHNNGVKTLCPVITVTDAVRIVYNGVTTELTAGSYKISDLRLYSGANVIDVSGTGTVSFTYREADL